MLSCFSGDAKFEELRYAHRAKLNIIICSKSLTNLAKKMQKTYGMPYLEESFYGMTDTAKALRDIARELDNIVGGLEKRVMQERVERLIEEEEAKCRAAIALYRTGLEGKSAVLFTGGGQDLVDGQLQRPSGGGQTEDRRFSAGRSTGFLPASERTTRYGSAIAAR